MNAPRCRRGAARALLLAGLVPMVPTARAEAHAGPAGLTALVGYQRHGRVDGSTPLSDFLAWQEAQDPHQQRSYWLRAHRATALAMLGRPEEALAVRDELRKDATERGATAVLSAV